MRIRFNIGGRRNSKGPKTETGYYTTAIWCFFAELIYLFKLINNGGFRLDTSIVLLPFFIIFTTTAVLNLIKGIKLTRKRLANKVPASDKRDAGYVYCTQCGCKLLEGIQVCPYCNEPIHTTESYETVRTASFEDASPEVKEKPSILLILSVIALVAGAVILIIYNISNPYRNMDTDKIYREAEAIMADFSKDKVGDMGKLIAELESREDDNLEDIRSEYDFIVDKCFDIAESASYNNGATLRRYISEIIAFDKNEDSWNLENLVDDFAEEYKLYIVFGHKWVNANQYFYLHYKDETKARETLSVALPNDKEPNIKYTFDYKTDKESGFILFWYTSESGQIIDAYQIWDVFYTDKHGWAVEIYIESSSTTVILYE